jgi:hypothetical protein
MSLYDEKYVCVTPDGEMMVRSLARTPAGAQTRAAKLQEDSIRRSVEAAGVALRIPQLSWRHLAECGWRWVAVREVPDEDPVFGYPLTRLVECGGGTSAAGAAADTEPGAATDTEPGAATDTEPGADAKPKSPKRWMGIDAGRAGGDCSASRTITRQEFFGSPALSGSRHVLKVPTGSGENSNE